MALLVALPALSILLLVAICRSWVIPPTVAEKAQNGLFWLTVRPLSFYADKHGDEVAPIVQCAVYAQERAELVIKWTGTLLAGNVAALVTAWAMPGNDLGDAWQPLAMFVAFGALAYGLQRSAPAIRWREYIGHAVELCWINDHAPTDFAAAYTVEEARQMAVSPVYEGLFDRDNVIVVLRTAEPRARVMLWLIGPALRRFAAA